MDRIRRKTALGLVTLLTACGPLGRCFLPAVLSKDELDALYAAPLPPPAGPLRVFHLGHSLVGHDMPAMLTQLAGNGHLYDIQVGSGTPMRAHWEPRVPVLELAVDLGELTDLPAKPALESGAFDAFVVTEMVEIKDAIRYHDSAEYLAKWAGLAREGRGDIRIFLYETWHWLDDPAGWVNRIEEDLEPHWETGILASALGRDPDVGPIHVIPAGQVLGRVTRALQAEDPDFDPALFFGTAPDGSLDTIHMGDIGNYIVALTHYAVLYQRSPVGLPHRLHKADGRVATALDEALVQKVQQIVWEVVTTYPKTGVPQQEG